MPAKFSSFIVFLRLCASRSERGEGALTSLDHGTGAGVGLVPAHGLACFGLTLVPSLMRRKGAPGLEELAAVGLIAAVDVKRRDPALRVCDGHLLLRIDKLHQQRLSPSDHARVAMEKNST